MATETVLVEDHLLNFINKIAVEQKYEKFDTKITPVSSGGANYTSNLFKVKIIQEGREDLNLFAKVIGMHEEIRSQTLFNPFDNEWIFFKHLAEVYRQLEENHSVPEKDRIKLSAFFGVEATHGQEILVLEDLTSRGFMSPNRFESVDWSYAAAAVTELAKFHALSLTYKHENPIEFEKFISQFRTGLLDKGEGTDVLVNGLISTALAAVRKENKEIFEEFLMSRDFITFYNNLHGPLNCNVILHADFRPDNMLHRVLNDGTTEVIPVDYQTIQPGSPAVDLIYFIFASTDASFRAKYLDILIDHYYSELGVALERFGLHVEDEYSRKEFESDFQQKLPFGLLMTVLLLPFITISKDDVPEIGFDFASLASVTTGELYSQRLNEVVDYYIELGILRAKI